MGKNEVFHMTFFYAQDRKYFQEGSYSKALQATQFLL